MNRSDFENATEDVLKLVLDQAQLRLEAQNAFADTQDNRASSVINTGVTLGAAAVAVAAGSFSIEQPLIPLAIGSTIAAVGFVGCSALLMWSLRSASFDSAGYFPEDFVADVSGGKTSKDVTLDMVESMQRRLSDNKKRLDDRGHASNAAIGLLIATPLVALIVSLLSAWCAA
jgi:hypothetical protein